MPDNRFFIRPAPGIVLRKPVSQQVVPHEGAWVPDTEFWRRRIADGDAVRVTSLQKPEEAGNNG